MNLQLYEYYTREEIFAEFPNAQADEAEGWFLSNNRVIGLFAIGERPPENHFCDSTRFHWHGQPGEAPPQPLCEFKQVDGAHLFIKSPTENRYAYVARIKHVGMHGSGSSGGEACMDIDPHIPTEFLHKLGGLYIHPDGHHAMNRAVAMLRAASTPAERFAAFRSFVESWRGPLEDNHAIAEDEFAKSKVPIPKILEKFYRWAGTCHDVTHAGYMSINKPDELSANEYGYVNFCAECQWCGNYFLRQDALSDEDPEVYADECGDNRNGEGFHATGVNLSRFLWAYYIAFNVYSGPLAYQVSLNRDEFENLKTILDPLPILTLGRKSCRAIQAYHSKIDEKADAAIFARDGVMGVLLTDDHSPQIYLRSKTQSAIGALLATINIDPSRLEDPC